MPAGKGKEAEIEIPTALVLAPHEKDKEVRQDQAKLAETSLVELFTFPKWEDNVLKSLPKLKATDTFERELPTLCPELAKNTKGWRRIHEIYTDIQTKEIELQKKRREEEPDDEDEPLDETVKEPIMVAPRAMDSEEQEDLAAGTNNFWATYLTSQLNFISHAVKHLPEKLPENGQYLWKNIYPQDKKGMPTYQKDGRYVVRIFYHSAWRSVVVDDRIPVDANGVPVFPLSMGWLDAGECWPLILAKALCYVDRWDCPKGGLNFLNYLCGWVTHEHVIKPALVDTGDAEEGGTEQKAGEGGNDAEGAGVNVHSQWMETLGHKSCLGAYLFEEPPFSTDAPPMSPSSPAPDAAVTFKLKEGIFSEPNRENEERKDEEAKEGKQEAGKAVAPAQEEEENEKPKKEGDASAEVKGEDGADAKDGAAVAAGGIDRVVSLSSKSTRRRRIHIPHPRCYLIRPLNSSSEGDDAEKKKEAGNKNAQQKKSKDTTEDKETAEGEKNAESKGAMLEYTNLCPRLKKRRKRLTLDGRQEEEKPTTLSFKGTSATEGAWKRFPIYTVVYPRETLEFKREVKDLWTDQSKAFSNQPRHLLCAADHGKKGPLTVHLTFDPLQSLSVAAKDLAPAIKTEGGEGKDSKHPARDLASSSGEKRETAAKESKDDTEASEEEELGKQPTKVKIEVAETPKQEIKDASETAVTSKKELRHSYLVVVHEHDWYTHTQKLVLERVCTGFSYIRLQLDRSKQYSILVQNECGCHIFASATEPFDLQKWDSGKGYRWSGVEGKDYYTVSENVQTGSYGMSKKGEWMTLFNLQVKVPKSIKPKLWKPSPMEEGQADNDAASDGPVLQNEKFRVSVCLHVMDSSLKPYVVLHWVNNDTHQVQQSLLLDASPRILGHNETGYSLTASVKLPCDIKPGDWKLTMLSVVPFADLKISHMPLTTQFSGKYAHNHTLTLLREVISCEAEQAVTVKIACSDPKAAFHARLFDVETIKVEEGLPTDSKYISKLSRIGVCFFPSLPIGSKKYLLTCHLDPLKVAEEYKLEGKLQWTITFSSENPVTLETDTTKEKYFEAVKQGWGNENPKRAENAKQSREKYLEEKKAPKDTNPPKIIQPGPEEKAVIVDEAVRKTMREASEKAHIKASNHHKAVLMWRDYEVKAQLEDCEQKMKETKEWSEETKVKTEEYTSSLKAVAEELQEFREIFAKVRETMEKDDVEELKSALKTITETNAPDWRFNQLRDCAAKRATEISIKRFIGMLEAPLASRDFIAILEHAKNLLSQQLSESNGEGVGEGADKNSNAVSHVNAPIIPYSLQKWIDYSVETTKQHVFKTIDTAMGDEETKEADIDKKAITEMLAIFDKLKEIRKTEEALGISKDEADLLADARDIVAAAEAKS